MSIIPNDGFISRKCAWLSIVAMTSVVILHSTACFTVEKPAAWNVLVQYLVTQSFTYWAVPFFFAMSGFWFARGGYMQGKETLTGFFKKKSRTLLVPYLLWAVLGAVLTLPLIIGNNYLTHRGLLERTFLSAGTVWNSVCALFALDRLLPSGNGPLWYVRSLLLLFVAAPLWRACMRTKFGTCVLLLVWLGETFVYPYSIAVIELLSMALGWFAFGILAAKCRWETLRVPSSLWMLAGVVWTVVSILKATQVAGFTELPSVIYEKMLTLIPYGGILFLWGLYDRMGLDRRQVPQWMRATFWVYCFHSIPGGYVIAGMKGVFGKSDGVNLLTMFIAIVNVPLLSYAASCWAKRTIPRVYAILTGGRG